MKKYLSTFALLSLLTAFASCTNPEVSMDSEVKDQEVVQAEPTLNDNILIFNERMEKYLANGERDNDELERLHLDFVPILGWKEFKGDEIYEKDAKALGGIVHEMQESNDEEYPKLLKTLKPAYLVFYSKYGN